MFRIYGARHWGFFRGFFELWFLWGGGDKWIVAVGLVLGWSFGFWDEYWRTNHSKDG